MITLTSLGGFDFPVELTFSDLPTELSGVIEPVQTIPPDTSVFKVYASSVVQPGGNYYVTISAEGGGFSREKQAMLNVRRHVLHVSPEGSDLTGCGSAEYPFATIQRGIDRAYDGDTVLVEKGFYQENINFSGKNILVTSRYIFDGMETTIESTIIDGGGNPLVVQLESATATLCGFTIRNGLQAAVVCIGGSPTIMHNIFTQNLPNYPDGGVVVCLWSRVRIVYNLIYNNLGGGVGLGSCFCPEVVNNTICNNGGGIKVVVETDSALIKNNIIVSNNDYGIYSEGSNCLISFNDVWNNDSNYAGTLSDQTGINGNISVDPFFTAPDKWNYYLFPLSSCINAGDPNDSVPPGGEPTVDMGAFEHTTFYGQISSDTTWEKTVHVVGDVTVESDATLTIMPNTTVVFDSTDISQSGIDSSMCELIVQGSLRASGSKSDSITFMSTDTSEHPVAIVSLKGGSVEEPHGFSLGLKRRDEAAEDPKPFAEDDTTVAWYGIRVLPGGSVRVDYANIVDVCKGISLANTAPDTISNCLFLNNQVGISCSNSNALIMNNRICYWPIGSIAIHLNDISNSLSLKDNLLENYRIHVCATNCSTTIVGNTLLACNYENQVGIHCTDSKYFKVKSTHMARRRFHECYIKADHSTLHLDNCRLEGAWWQMRPQ